MKVSLDWLEEYIDTNLSCEQIAEILSDLGFPSEGMEHIDGDVVNDIEVTSNRGDCLSMIGVARELAAFTGKSLKLPNVQIKESDVDVNDIASVDIEAPELCGRYTARVIQDVKIGPSPGWMVKRLEAAGLRSVNNVVDATNYAMLETGQPPHAFDFDKITDGRIIVRKANLGERIVSIDGTKCDLNQDYLIIADAKQPVAIAGVMGGLDTEVTEKTTNILLEEASFDPVTVRTAARRLALPSEAAFRFERIVDIENIDWASKRTAQLIVQVAGGKIAKGVIDAYPEKTEKKYVKLRPSRVNHLLGFDINADEIMLILTRLGFTPQLDGDIISCSVPSWRSDIYREVDLIEEVIRVYGYNNVPTQNKIHIEVTPVDKTQKLKETACKMLNGAGYFETVNVTFVDDKIADLFSETEFKMRVKDVSRKSDNQLRQSLIGSLLTVLKVNVNAKNTPCKVFEIANTFVPLSDDNNALPRERTKLGMVSDGQFREICGTTKAVIENIAKNCRVVFEPADFKWAKTGACIKINDSIIGSAGIVSDEVRSTFDFKDVVPVAAQIDFEMLKELMSGEMTVKPIPRFPAIQRDLSLILDDWVRWSQITEAVNASSPQELEDVSFVDIYRGKGVESGKKSLTLSLLFRDEDGTLTHETVDSFEKTIVESLKRSTGAQIRTA